MLKVLHLQFCTIETRAFELIKAEGLRVKVYTYINSLGFRYFPKGIFPSGNFPSEALGPPACSNRGARHQSAPIAGCGASEGLTGKGV